MRWTFWEDREREIEKGHGKKLDESDYLGLFG